MKLTAISIVLALQVFVTMDCAMAQKNAGAPRENSAEDNFVRSIPHEITSVPLDEDTRQRLIAAGAIGNGDETTHAFVTKHSMHSKDLVQKTAPQTGALVTNKLGPGPTTGSGPLNYYNGQVITSPIIVPVFWGFGVAAGQSIKFASPATTQSLAAGSIPDQTHDPDGVAQYAFNFLRSLPSSPWFATLNEYYNGNPQNPVQTSSTTITAPIFDDTTVPPAQYHDSDVGNEAGRIASAIGNNSSEIIIVFTSHGTTDLDERSGECAAHYSSQGLNFLSMVHNYTLRCGALQPRHGRLRKVRDWQCA